VVWFDWRVKARGGFDLKRSRRFGGVGVRWRNEEEGEPAARRLGREGGSAQSRAHLAARRRRRGGSVGAVGRLGLRAGAGKGGARPTAGEKREGERGGLGRRGEDGPGRVFHFRNPFFFFALGFQTYFPKEILTERTLANFSKKNFPHNKTLLQLQRHECDKHSTYSKLNLEINFL
jgi:hypothetical protein